MDSLLVTEVLVLKKERRETTVVGGLPLWEPWPLNPMSPLTGRGLSPQPLG